jgi:hypothetical protein
MQTNNKNNGLNDIINKLNDNYINKEGELINSGINIIKLNSFDIQRHPIVAKLTNIYNR